VRGLGSVDISGVGGQWGGFFRWGILDVSLVRADETEEGGGRLEVGGLKNYVNGGETGFSRGSFSPPPEVRVFILFRLFAWFSPYEECRVYACLVRNRVILKRLWACVASAENSIPRFIAAHRFRLLVSNYRNRRHDVGPIVHEEGSHAIVSGRSCCRCIWHHLAVVVSRVGYVVGI